MVFGIDPGVELSLYAALFSVFSFEATRRLGNRKRQKEIQKTVNDYQKDLQKAVKSGDEAEIKKLEAREKQVMGLMNEMMLLPFKSMLVILPAFFIVITIITGAYQGFSASLPIGLHTSELFALKILQPSVYGPRGYFILSAVLFGLVIEYVYSNFIEKKKLAAQNGSQPAASTTP